MITKPDISTIPDYFVYYTKLVPENELIEALRQSSEQTVELFSSIPLEN